ncbi:MAG TPA: IS21-like element helper ATPase IstB [Thiotrichales bacterium]|nr:IS21-like element helper ATPase IstB [Thiotrichales bacterium]
MSPNNIVMSLRALKLGGMADALEQQLSVAVWRETSFEERLEHLITQEINLRSQRKIDRIRKLAKLHTDDAMPEKFDYNPARGIDKSIIAGLLKGSWIKTGKTNLLITGLTGTGKTWLACTLGNVAARLELTVGYHKVGDMLEELEFSRHDGQRLKKIDHFRKLDLLILDDFGLNNLNHNAVVDLLSILDDRVGKKSTIVTGQMPIDHWHEYLGGDATADAIMDRLIYSSQKIQLKGDTLRANQVVTL